MMVWGHLHLFHHLPLSTQPPFLAVLIFPDHLCICSRAPLWFAAILTSLQVPSFNSHNLCDSTCSRLSRVADIRLPKLTLPTFSGDPLNWLMFWDSFYTTIHANPNLSGVQKLSFLKAQLKGDAARTIAGLPLTEGNYASSITLLEDRYGRRHKIINAHIRALRDIPSPSNSLNSLRSVSSMIQWKATFGDWHH